MTIDAAHIVAFHLALQRANPDTQILWWPASSGQQYGDHAELSTTYGNNVNNNDINAAVATITARHGNAAVIQLTLYNGTLYFKSK